MHDLDRNMFESGETAFGEAEYEVASQEQELELATELLEIGHEAELDRFIGDLFRSVAGTARDFARSDTGRALGGIVKNAVGQSLPVVGRAVGGALSPSGGDIGERVGSAAGALLGLELETLSAEDRELEIARALVRFAREACRQALAAPRTAPPPVIAQAAATRAAQRYAPGLLPALLDVRRQGTRPTATYPIAVSVQSGRWVRDERGHIVLLGV